MSRRRGSAGTKRASALVMGAALLLALANPAPAGATPAVVNEARVTPAPLRYRTVQLGTLGGQSSVARAMNDRGDVVGRAQTADGQWHGFLWRRGKMRDLESFDPIDINNRGQIIGTRDDRGGSYLWQRGVVTELPGGLRYPNAINDRGQVVGVKAIEVGTDVPVLLSRGNVRVLPLDSASDVNNRGQVSGGRALDGGGFHAALWRRGRVVDLGAAAFNRSNSYGINDRGWVIGWTFSADQFERGTLWRNGTTTDLGTLGGRLTRAVAINDRGLILATSQVADGNLRPALWRRGVLTDLSTAGLDPDGEVADLNDAGAIAGSVRPVFGTAHAVVYLPARRHRS